MLILMHGFVFRLPLLGGLELMGAIIIFSHVMVKRVVLPVKNVDGRWDGS